MSEHALAFLRTLPDVDPPAGLWSRIERAQSRRRATRRALSFGMAASVLLAMFVLGLKAFEPQGDPGASVADAIARSHALERDLAAVRGAGAGASMSLEAELARVDAGLSRAYSRRADAAELQALWNARVTALETLVALHRHPEAIRI